MRTEIENIKKTLDCIYLGYKELSDFLVYYFISHKMIWWCYVTFCVIFILNNLFFTFEPYRMSRIIIFILFFLIDVFTLVIIGKVKVHQIYYDKPDNTELLKNVISKNAAGRALFIFIQTLLFGSMYIEKIDKFIADENFSIALGWCFLFFMICLVLYILAIRYDSCIVKTLAIFPSRVYAILPVVYFFLKDNDPFFSTETFSKLTYVLVWILHLPESQTFIWIFLGYATAVSLCLPALIPKFHIRKLQYAMNIMNIGVSLFTFYLFMDSESISHKKEIIVNEIKQNYHTPFMQELNDEMKRLEEKNTDLSYQEFLDYKANIPLVEDFFQEIESYVLKIDGSDIRDTGYMLLFPYVISFSLSSLVINIRKDKIFSKEAKDIIDIYDMISEKVIEQMKYDDTI